MRLATSGLELLLGKRCQGLGESQRVGHRSQCRRRQVARRRAYSTRKLIQTPSTETHTCSRKARGKLKHASTAANQSLSGLFTNFAYDGLRHRAFDAVVVEITYFAGSFRARQPDAVILSYRKSDSEASLTSDPSRDDDAVCISLDTGFLDFTAKLKTRLVRCKSEYACDLDLPFFITGHCGRPCLVRPTEPLGWPLPFRALQDTSSTRETHQRRTFRELSLVQAAKTLTRQRASARS